MDEASEEREGAKGRGVSSEGRRAVDKFPSMLGPQREKKEGTMQRKLVYFPRR